MEVDFRMITVYVLLYSDRRRVIEIRDQRWMGMWNNSELR